MATALAELETEQIGAAPYRRPSLLKTAFEGRWVMEFASLVAATPLAKKLPKGDGHTVLVIPGFMTGDSSTAVMRKFLRSLGYDAQGWRLGVNRGPHPGSVEKLYDRFFELSEYSPISLVGWSLGGMYAREMARRYPERVRQVITLASPYRTDDVEKTRASAVYDAVYLQQVDEPITIDRSLPLGVPATSVFTKGDGIVDWRACVDVPGPQRESIEIIGASHLGIGVNPATFAVLADRLAQPPGEWERFVATGPLRTLVRTEAGLVGSLP